MLYIGKFEIFKIEGFTGIDQNTGAPFFFFSPPKITDLALLKHITLLALQPRTFYLPFFTFI